MWRNCGLGASAALERMELPGGSYYISELEGCEVWERAASANDAASTQLGVVRGVSAGGTPVLEVDTPDGEVLIPLATEICRKIDVGARKR